MMTIIKMMTMKNMNMKNDACYENHEHEIMIKCVKLMKMKIKIMVKMMAMMNIMKN